MNDIALLRTAAIELSNVDDNDVVKVAGVLRRIKNWWKAFNDPKYKQQVEELRNKSSFINGLLSDLEQEIAALQSSIADTDVATYESSLQNVRALSAQLSTALKDYRHTTDKAESGAPSQTVEVSTTEDTPAVEGDSRIQNYTQTQLKDPNIRAQLANQLPAEYDVPLNKTLNQPLINFGWFSALSPANFYLSEEFIKYFQKALAEVLALRKIRLTAEPEQDLATYSLIVQMPEVEQQIRQKLPLAAIDGKLIRVDFQKPSKQVSHRNANEMLTVIQTAPFEIVLPAAGIFDGPKKLLINAVVLFNDMRAAYIGGQQLSAAGVKNLRIIDHDFSPVQGYLKRNDELKKLAGQNIHQWARDILQKAFRQVMGREPTLAELQLAQAVSWRESNYGRGWRAKKNPDGRGPGSNNWGAVQSGRPHGGSCPVGSFMYTDTHPTSSGTSVPYQICFRAYPTPVDGAADVVKLLFKSKSRAAGIQQAAQQGSINDFSTTMYDSHYYEGFGKNREQRIKGHANWIRGAINTITKALNEPAQFNDISKPDSAPKMIATKPSAQPPQDIMQEYQSLLKQLAASKDYGPVEALVRKSIERSVLPTTRILLEVQTGQSLPVRIRYARILASALREELGAESSIHHKKNKLELECDVVGTEKTAHDAVNGIADYISKLFETATNGKLVKTQSYLNLQSRYPLIDPHTSEVNFRKFAFEIMEHNG